MAGSETRVHLLEVLTELSLRYPAWRLGQLVANVVDWADGNVWDIEDADIVRVARRHLSHYAAPAQGHRQD